MNFLPTAPPTQAQAVFLMLAGLAALMAVGVVVMPSPVRSAMCLVVNFFLLAFIYFTLGAQHLGIIQILVYTGAIMVLFLFVIMLLNLGGKPQLKERLDVKPVIGLILGVALFGLMASQVLLPMKDIVKPASDSSFGGPRSIGFALMTTYAWPFEITSVLLLVGIVGSILLAKRRVQ